MKQYTTINPPITITRVIYQVHFLHLIFDLTINLINKMAMMNGKYSCDDQFLPRGKAVS